MPTSGSLRVSRSLIESGSFKDSKVSSVELPVMKKTGTGTSLRRTGGLTSTLSKTGTRTLAGASLSEIHSVEHERYMKKAMQVSKLQEIKRMTECATTTNFEARALIDQLNATDFSQPIIAVSDRAKDEINQLKGQLRAQEQVMCNLKAEKSQLESQLENLIQQLADLQTAHNKLISVSAGATEAVAEVDTVRAQLSSLQAENTELMAINQRLEEQARMTAQNMAAMSQEHGAAAAQIEALQNEVNYYLEKRQLDLQERRRLHSIIQDLRGAVRVAVRLRPSRSESLSGSQDNQDTGIRFLFPDSETDQRMLSLFGKPEKSIDGMKTRRPEHSFEFDHVYAMTATQQNIWNDVSELVQSALDGYRVCLFAYGQTASGKTHTMLGPSTSSWASMPAEDKGIMPRAVEQIFIFAHEASRDKWEYRLTASFFEIYNDTVQDLLAPKGSGNIGKKCQVMRDANGNAYVDNLFRKEVSSPEELNWLLCQAFDNRATGSTDMNARSSRSHAIFQLDIDAYNESSNQRLYGQLNLVDLAGSENVEKSGAKEERLAEAIAINKSLSALSGVICSLVTKAAHVPYRDSKLTSILQPSLSGDSKTMVIVSLSPEECNYQETLNSLKFAARISGVEMSGKTRPRPAKPSK